MAENGVKVLRVEGGQVGSGPVPAAGGRGNLAGFMGRMPQRVLAHGPHSPTILAGQWRRSRYQ